MFEEKPLPIEVETYKEKEVEIAKVILESPKREEEVVVIKKKIIKKTILEEDKSNYMLEIALGVLLLIALVYIIYKKRKKTIRADIDSEI
ncbi:hypothetical protein [Sulfurimonas sp.]|uniref:hypothetical protein n=1 Tax=Sulfurimonas sp. TaxID=2022749 RepID=UPI002AB21E29|nr:hypothetical protein [Sulfurimonas sp.]